MTDFADAARELGIGIALRRDLAAELLRTPRAVDWLEIEPERWIGRGGRDRFLLDACAERWPIVPHSTSLSVGGPDAPDEDLLSGIAALSRRLRSPWWSDHLALSRVSGVYFHHPLPLPFSAEAVDHLAQRAREAEARVGLPLLLENISYLAVMPGSSLDEADFVGKALAASGAGLLLDIGNVYLNAVAHGTDPRRTIDRMPLDRLQQIHLASHARTMTRLPGAHAAPIADEVWDLYTHTLARAARPVPTLIEWDVDLPSLDRLLDEVDRARSLSRWSLEPGLAAGIA